jgi:hypothetical protein
MQHDMAKMATTTRPTTPASSVDDAELATFKMPVVRLLLPVPIPEVTLDAGPVVAAVVPVDTKADVPTPEEMTGAVVATADVGGTDDAERVIPVVPATFVVGLAVVDERPADEIPVVDNAVVGEAEVGRAVVGKAVVGRAVVGEPVVPVVGEPVVGEPVVGEPVVAGIAEVAPQDPVPYAKSSGSVVNSAPPFNDTANVTQDAG